MRSDYHLDQLAVERQHSTCPRAYELLSKCFEAEAELLRQSPSRPGWRARKLDLDLLMTHVETLTSRDRDVNDAEVSVVEAKLRAILAGGAAA